MNLSGQSVCTDEAVIHSAVITADEEILLATKVDRGLPYSSPCVLCIPFYRAIDDELRNSFVYLILFCELHYAMFQYQMPLAILSSHHNLFYIKCVIQSMC